MTETNTTFPWTFPATFEDGQPVSPNPFSVEALTTILQDAGRFNAWTNAEPPRIVPIWEVDHNDRINYADPALYLWSPTDADISKFSIDGDNFLQDSTVEILIFTLDPTQTKEYQSDVIDILSAYYDDNTDRTNFYEIAPQSAADLRNEHVSGRTDHYIASVTVETNRFGQAGL